MLRISTVKRNAAEPTYAELQAERDELLVKLRNVHACLAAASIALRDAGSHAT